MKLLIVDDQLATLTGLCQDIDWKREGITEVTAAQNAMEARIMFRNGVPDIMICDIEMPVESGIQLGKWVRSMGYSTRIIYLTCHSEFEYAKEALELRAVDYILQPAPYEEIVEVVRRTIQDIKNEERKEKTLNKARDFEEKQRYFEQSIWKDWLTGRGNRKRTEEILEVPQKNWGIWLVLLQTVEWGVCYDRTRGLCFRTAKPERSNDRGGADKAASVSAGGFRAVYALPPGFISRMGGKFFQADRHLPGTDKTEGKQCSLQERYFPGSDLGRGRDCVRRGYETVEGMDGLGTVRKNEPRSGKPADRAGR